MKKYAYFILILLCLAWTGTRLQSQQVAYYGFSEETGQAYTPLTDATTENAQALREAAGSDAARLGLLHQPIWRLLGRPRALQCCPQWSREADVLLLLPEPYHG